MSNLKQVEHLILKARKKQIELDAIVEDIYILLADMNVNLEVPTEAYNALSLDEAISYYIHHNEYNLPNIMKEIKENMK